MTIVLGVVIPLIVGKYFFIQVIVIIVLVVLYKRKIIGKHPVETHVIHIEMSPSNETDGVQML